MWNYNHCFIMLSCFLASFFSSTLIFHSLSCLFLISSSFRPVILSRSNVLKELSIGMHRYFDRRSLTFQKKQSESSGCPLFLAWLIFEALNSSETSVDVNSATQCYVQ
jgi:hypothetical protein